MGHTFDLHVPSLPPDVWGYGSASTKYSLEALSWLAAQRKSTTSDYLKSSNLKHTALQDEVQPSGHGLAPPLALNHALLILIQLGLMLFLIYFISHISLKNFQYQKFLFFPI